MDFETVLFEVADGVATLTLNRPEVLNGLNRQLMTDIRAALKLAEHTRDARALILTGAGRGFCSGAAYCFCSLFLWRSSILYHPDLRTRVSSRRFSTRS